MTAEIVRLTAAIADRYRVERELGAGGMATVYLAHDLRHGRDVAIKVLHSDLGAALGGERFLAEIRTTAKLQHPHILPLLDSGATDGLLFYVMPYMTGETLRQKLERERQLSIDDAMRIAREVADALSAAHTLGIVHRDIKPENILLQGNHAVVADFGIALAVQTAGGQRMTQTGLSLGTPQYMAPEQAMGDKTIDARADIYALGAVTYEMLTGEPPFTGATIQAIVAKVLTERPMHLTSVRDTIPPHVDAAVLKALAKLPADRFATPAQFAEALAHPELMPAIGHASATLGVSGSKPAPHGMRRYFSASPFVWIALAATTAAAVVGWLRKDATSPGPALGVLIGDVRGIAVRGALGVTSFSLSADGASLAFSGTDSTGAIRLFVRSLTDANAPVTIASPYGANSAFSPDGQMLVFWTSTNQLVQIYRMQGRGLQTLGQARPVRGFTWIDDSTFVYASDGKLWRRRVTSQAPDVLVEKTDGADYAVPFAASSDQVLLQISDSTGTSELGVLTVHDKRITRLGVRGTRPEFVSAGIITYLSAGALWGVPVDPVTLKVRGQPNIIAEAGPSGAVSVYAVSRNGVLVVATGSNPNRELVLVDRSGTARALLAEQRAFRWPRFSPDGGRVAVTILQNGMNRGDVWVVGSNGSSTEARTLTRLTADSSTTEPEWDPDGRNLIVRRTKPGTPGHLERIAADGGGTSTVLLTRTNQVYESAITKDRRTVVWREDAPGAARDILMASLDSPTVAHPIHTTAFDERGFALSPDDKWLAYTSNETGSDEVYISRLEPNGAHWRASRHGGSEPRWAQTGELFYRNADSLFASKVTLGSEPSIGAPTLLFTAKNYVGSPFEPLWDVTRDGQRLVMVREPEGSGSKLVLMLNWIERWRSGRGSQ